MTTRFPGRYSLSEGMPEGLYEKTLLALGRARTRAARIRLALSGIFIASSTAGFAFAIQATVRVAAASGFTSFASLALSDTSIIARHAQEFLLSLAETLPGVQLAAALFTLSVLLVSVRAFIITLARPTNVSLRPGVHA